MTGLNAISKTRFTDIFLDRIIDDHMTKQGADKTEEQKDFVDVQLNIQKDDSTMAPWHHGESIKAIILSIVALNLDLYLSLFDFS